MSVWRRQRVSLRAPRQHVIMINQNVYIFLKMPIIFAGVVCAWGVWTRRNISFQRISLSGYLKVDVRGFTQKRIWHCVLSVFFSTCFYSVLYWCLLKTAFHYSSQLQTWFSTRFAAKFSTSSCRFATRFRPAFDIFVENFVANLLHQSGHVEIDAAGSQQVCWFVRVLDKIWNVEKNRFKQVRSWLSTCFRPACDQVCIQVCSLLE